MKPDLRVRPATPADHEQLTDWALAMALETEHKRLQADIVRRGVGIALANPAHGRYWIAERGGQAAGTAMVTYEWSDWRAADWWWLQSVYVAPAHRRCGVFRALYAQIQREARAAGNVCGLRLYVEKQNLHAQHTYLDLGMRDAGYFMYEAPLDAH